MHWIQSDYITYALCQNDEQLAVLMYQEGAASLLKIGNEVYSIRSKGIWNPSYNITSATRHIATLYHNFWGSSGVVRFLDDAAYNVKYAQMNEGCIRFVEQGGTNEEVLRYGIHIRGNKPEPFLHVGTTLIDAEQLLILSALGLHILLSMTREFMLPDDMEFHVSA
jgi:hypothetical protein